MANDVMFEGKERRIAKIEQCLWPSIGPCHVSGRGSAPPLSGQRVRPI